MASSGPVALLPLSEDEKETIRACFCEDSAKLASIKSHVLHIVLPKIKDALGWTSVRAIKGRVNDWRTVELKYNSLFHRDRHIYGNPKSVELKSASRQNLSAVVYLDPSRFDFIDGSSLAGHQGTKLQELTIAEGTIAVFPSCLIHRAVASSASQRRRTIVIFDIENPDEAWPLRHDIVTCPAWTQKPLLDGIFGADNVEEQMLQDLIANRPYFWRYYRRDSNRRVHWQVTTAASGCPLAVAEHASAIAYNTSFYLIGPQEYPKHVKVHDHRSTFWYVLNLVRFHLGFEVID
jgi:hypothetical protein